MPRKPAFQPLAVRKLADRSEGERLVRFLARNVQVDEDGNALIDPSQVERILFNPATPELEHEPWPLAGLEVDGEPPARTRVGTRWVDGLAAEGLVTFENERVVHKPGGPPSSPWRVTHTFRHADAIVFKTVNGELRYRVTRQPDKYDGGPENGTGKPTEAAGDPETSVDWFYDLELEA
jgi:hypothetical protein